MLHLVIITDPADGNFRDHFHGILYQIKGDEVRMLAIRRPSQDLMEPEDHSE
jgi:hypothetical protein